MNTNYQQSNVNWTYMYFFKKMHQYKTYIVKLCHIKTAEIFFNKTIKMLPNAMYVCHIEQ